jgi:hypothetical protein
MRGGPFCFENGDNMEKQTRKKRKPLKDCIVKPGEKSPYANLLVDLAFKKAFDPDKPASRQNLVNLLNDLLEPFFRFLNRLKELPAELDEKKFEHLTESSKVSKFSKKEFEAYQKVYHKEWDHNAMVDGIFEEFADEINAKVAESVSERERKMAREMLADKEPIDKISRYTGLSEEDIRKL